MKELIEIYKNEILLAKDSAERLKSIPVAHNVAIAKQTTYERVVDDLKSKLNEQRTKEVQEEVLLESANPVDFKNLDNYINDFDNLKDTGHFHKEIIDDYTFHHKEMSFTDFMCKGREFLRLLWIREKQKQNRK